MASHLQTGASASNDGARATYGTAVHGAGFEPPAPRRGVPVWALVVCILAALAVGGLVGRFLLTPNISYLEGAVTITSDQLDGVVGSYYSDGEYHEITARQALEATASLESHVTDEGTYPMPSAESIINVARNQLLQDAVHAEGIEVTDADADAYRQKVFGDVDVATLAENYAMSAEQFNQLLIEGAGVEKLYQQVAGGDAIAPAVPELPPAPAEGQEDTPTQEYGAYIVKLLGDNWDSAKNTWANRDNPYYEVMEDDVFSADGATYNQAMEAYYVAYGIQTENNQPSIDAWDAYMNDLLSKASITIGELVS